MRDFLSKLHGFAAEYQMLPAGGTVLCALSGGADSVALLHALAMLRDSGGFSVCAAHLNHALRGEESDGDAAFCAAFCADLEIPLITEDAPVAAIAKHAKSGIEETARTLRYAFLERAAAAFGATRIATAHNADDNAETFLLHLLRGSGLHGLRGIAPRRDSIVRPLLTHTRQEILAYLTVQQLPHREDSSNADLTFARNRLRHTVLPLLQDFNPRFSESMTQTLRTLREDDAYLTARAMEVVRRARGTRDGGLLIAATALTNSPAALAPRIVQQLAAKLGMPALSALQIQAILTLARGEHPSATVRQLPDGWMGQRLYEDILFTRAADVLPPFSAVPLIVDGVTAWDDGLWTVSCRPVLCPRDPEQGVYHLNPDALEGTPLLRPRQSGDSLKLPNRPEKSLKKWLIEQKFPRRLREQLPVLADDKGLVAVAELGADERRLAAPGQPAYRLLFQRRY